MNHNPQLTVTKVSWRAVAQMASQLAGKTYNACYIREVATGYRPNRQLEPILKSLGFLNGEAA